jgi:hypothetical protein
MQADRDFLEALYEKTETAQDPKEAGIIHKHLAERAPTGEVLVELMDLIRCHPDDGLMLKALAFAMRMPTTPKEALWLAETLLLSPMREEDRAMVEDWRRDLAAKRATGTEAYY